LSGELANLRGDKAQMDFGALDYSNDKKEGRAGRCWPFTHITITFKRSKIVPKHTPAKPSPKSQIIGDIFLSWNCHCRFKKYSNYIEIRVYEREHFPLKKRKKKYWKH